jgi:hypothetical protein
MNENGRAEAPDALLLMATGCPHCPAVLRGLRELTDEGLIGKLETVNISEQPGIAQQYGVRTVPWLRLGPFELDGLRTPGELRQWAERARSPLGMDEYFRELLLTGQLHKVISMVRQDTGHFDSLIRLLSDPGAALQVHLGISAVIEDFAGSESLQKLVPGFGELSRSEDPRIRTDAAHFLALTGSADAIPLLRQLADDPDAQVREVAGESLAGL